MEEALAQAIGELTGSPDTHPSLADRLQALGVSPAIELPPEESAARSLLGEQYAFLVEQAGFLWSSSVHVGWQAEHQRLLTARERVAMLEAQRESRALTAEEAFEYADLREDIEPDCDALPLYQSVLRLESGHIGAQFATARLLLARDDAAGVPIVRRLESADELDLRLAASALLSSYYARTGNESAAEASLARAQQAHAEKVGQQLAHPRRSESGNAWKPARLGHRGFPRSVAVGRARLTAARVALGIVVSPDSP